jgi:beta-lactam-binding protein with PASTA domain
MVVIVIGLIWGVTRWLNSYTHHDESVRVPVVAGMTAEEAALALQDVGLVPMVIDSVYTNVAPGAVIEQLPEGNLPVKLGRIVYLTINARSRKMVVMPDLHDWSSRQAKSRLVEAGFVVDSVKLVPYEYDDLVMDITAGGVSVRPGRQYPVQTHLVLHVGTTHDLELDNDSIGFETDAEDEAAAADFLME